MVKKKIDYIYRVLLICMALTSHGFYAQTTESEKPHKFYASAGINQLFTTEHGLVEVPTLSGINLALGIGPIWRITMEGQFSAHRMWGGGEGLKNGYLLSYSWRSGIIPYKPVPLMLYGGGGYHFYHMSYKPVELMGQPFLPVVRNRRPTDYVTFGATYPFYKWLELDLSYRREPFFRNNMPINANYISVGVNAWLYKYDRFPRPTAKVKE
jgi:hypothetical protein